MEEALHERVTGQNAAILAVSEAVRMACTGPAKPDRPIGSFLFPTWWGRGSCRALAEYPLDYENDMIPLDKSEYRERHAASRLVGTSPGYVGYEVGRPAHRCRPSPPLLDGTPRRGRESPTRCPYMLLQLLDNSRLTDGKGRTISFANTVAIMTSNAACAHLIPGPVGLRWHVEKVRERLLEELGIRFRLEFLDRVGEIIVFHTISDDELTEIASLLFDGLCEAVHGQDTRSIFSKAIVRRIALEGRGSRFGARSLHCAVSRLVGSPLSK